jgi:signal transduction histidine kinase
LALETVTTSSGIDPKISRMAERGQNGIRRAQDLVRSLLAFARAGAKSTPGERADAAEVVRAVIEETRPLAVSRGVELVTECSAAESLEAACEPVLLMVVVRNLVQNAVKYVPSSGLRRVTVRAMRVRAAIRLEVEDTGDGVPEELRKRVFEPYWRGAHGRPGIGLGLATVRRIVEAHSGRVSIESPASGSLFRVDLPAARDEKPAAYARSWRSRLRRLLIVT